MFKMINTAGKFTKTARDMDTRAIRQNIRKFVTVTVNGMHFARLDSDDGSHKWSAVLNGRLLDDPNFAMTEQDFAEVLEVSSKGGARIEFSNHSAL